MPRKVADESDDLGRRRAAALAGHRGDEAVARRLLSDPAGAVRATALGALARMDRILPADVALGRDDADPVVRRRACEVAVSVPEVDLAEMLADADAGVVEAACWALGERGSGAVAELSAVASGHDDPLCREAAVAALGAIGDAAGLPAILAAMSDKPAVRRRAAWRWRRSRGRRSTPRSRGALQDRDWQVRQAAEDLLREDG